MNPEKNILLSSLLNELYFTSNDRKQAIIDAVEALDKGGMDFTQIAKQNSADLSIAGKMMAEMAFGSVVAEGYYGYFYKALITTKERIIAFNVDNTNA